MISPGQSEPDHLWPDLFSESDYQAVLQAALPVQLAHVVNRIASFADGKGRGFGGAVQDIPHAVHGRAILWWLRYIKRLDLQILRRLIGLGISDDHRITRIALRQATIELRDT